MTVFLKCGDSTAIEISDWLKSNGLKYEIDYFWDDNFTTSTWWFRCNDKRWENLILLKYGK